MTQDNKNVAPFSTVMPGETSIDARHPLVVKDITLSPNYKFAPTKLKFACFIIVTEGTFSISINLTEYHVEKGAMISIHSDKTITDYHTDKQVSLRILAYNPDFLACLLPDFTEALPTLIKREIKDVSQLSNGRLEDMNQWFDFLKLQCNRTATPGNFKVIRNLLSAFHLHLLEIACRENEEPVHKRTRREELMAQFLIALNKHCKQQREVNFYASLLCVSPKHLSAVVKAVSGVTATKFINRYVIIEAQILLRSTDFTIQQIAAQLNFPNQSFFGKYFKKITGLSPNAYRHAHYK